MKKYKTILITSLLCLALFSTGALADVNVNLLNLSAPEQTRLQNTYSTAYGFPVEQISPVMMAPPTEVPLILQLAKSATTLPVAIWGLRKMGFSYTDILSMYTLPPTVLVAPEVPYERLGPTLEPVVLYQKQYGPVWPNTVVLSDPALIQLGQISLFTVHLGIPSISLLALPDPILFPRIVLSPWSHPTYFIPPGQAMKMGLWMPPGQAKKAGLWSPPGHSKGNGGNGKAVSSGKKDHGGGKWSLLGGGGMGKGKGKN